MGKEPLSNTIEMMERKKPKTVRGQILRHRYFLAQEPDVMNDLNLLIRLILNLY